MSGLASIHTVSRRPLLSPDQQFPAPAGAGLLRTNASVDGAGSVLVDVSVDDLLDHTWHYQCVVSPTFSAAALAAALNIKYTAGSNGSCDNKSDQEKKPSFQSAVEHPVLRKLNLKVMDARICNPDSTDCQDGYVSLASLIIHSPSSTNTTSSCVTSPTSNHDDQSSPHHNHQMGLPFDLFNFMRKQGKSRSTTFTSTTCRDSARRNPTSRCNPAGDSTHMINGLYARCLTVD